METVLKGRGKKVVISFDRPAAIIGERINPTGKKRLAAALTAGDLAIIKDEAINQIGAGAHILDVNVGAAGVDEADLLPKAVRLVLETVEAPVDARCTGNKTDRRGRR
jgi:5-methyltetrahydrofolate--homocysteine methyltransferase